VWGEVADMAALPRCQRRDRLPIVREGGNLVGIPADDAVDPVFSAHGEDLVLHSQVVLADAIEAQVAKGQLE
jgi:hypothetical protein